MKEDILEQITEDWLLGKGYFVQSNVKFKPCPSHPDFVASDDRVNSDIDVLAINPLLKGPDRVIAVSCKSWQDGFSIGPEIKAYATGAKRHGRAAWKSMRELVVPKWGEALCSRVKELTGSTVFTHLLVATKVRGDHSDWEQHTPFQRNIGGNPARIVQLVDLVADIESRSTTTLASTQAGRLVQVLNAAGVRMGS